MKRANYCSWRLQFFVEMNQLAHWTSIPHIRWILLDIISKVSTSANWCNWLTKLNLKHQLGELLICRKVIGLVVSQSYTSTLYWCAIVNDKIQQFSGTSVKDEYSYFLSCSNFAYTFGMPKEVAFLSSIRIYMSPYKFGNRSLSYKNGM